MKFFLTFLLAACVYAQEPTPEDVKQCISAILPADVTLPEQLPQTMEELKEIIGEKFVDIRAKYQADFRGEAASQGVDIPEKAEEPAAEEPAATAEEPAATAEEPAATAEEPAATAEEPAATAEEPAATAEEPAAKLEQPEAAKESEGAAEAAPAKEKRQAPAWIRDCLLAALGDEALVPDNMPPTLDSLRWSMLAILG